MTRMDGRADNFDSLCRLCATYDAVKLEIFGEEGQERSLVEKIQTCLPFQVSENDPLPKSLCYRCMYNLENFYDFRMGCVSAVALLESCLQPDGGKNFDKATSERRAKIMKQMRKQSSRDTDAAMPQLEPQVPLPVVVKVESDDEMSNDSKSQTSDTAMPKLPSAVDDSGANTDDDVEEIDEYDDGEKVIDIDPADYLESNVAVGADDLNQGSSSRKKRSTVESTVVNKKGTGSCELYTCQICGKALSSKGHLSLHLRIHKDEVNDNSSSASSSSGQANPAVATQGAAFCRPYRCDLCNKSYSSSKHLWGHVSSNHRGDPAVTCPECHRLFSSVSNLEEHKRSKHGEQGSDEVEDNSLLLSRCGNDEGVTVCKKRSLGASRTPKYETEDQTNLNGKRPVTSDDASGNRRKSSKPRKIARTRSSESHGEATDNEALQCVLCLEKFSDVSGLMEHTKQHEEEHQRETERIVQSEPLSCLLCEKVFSIRSSLNHHLKNQHGIDPAELLEHQKDDDSVEYTDPQEFEVEVNINVKTEQEDQEQHMLAESMLESETVFCCEACIREFTDRSSLWLHMLYTHKEAAATACGLCLKVCGDLSTLSLHLQSCHTASQMLVDKRRYSCTVCMRQHDSRKKLLSHVLIHDIGDAKPEDLIILNSDLYQVELDRDHDQESAEKENHDSSTSSAAGNQGGSSLSGTAVTTATAVAANSPFACQICLKIFPNEEKMVKHKQNAHRQDALVHATSGTGTYHLFFRCEICGVSHQSKSDRWKHVYEEHKGDPSVTCSRSSCGKVFASAELNQEHVNHHKVQGATPNTCEICGKLWNSRVDYWKHMMGVHAEVVPDTCGVCLKVLPDLQQLMDHVKERHWPLTGGDYCCDICGRPYSNRSKMSRHRKIHFSVPGEDDRESLLEEDIPASKVVAEKRPSTSTKSEPKVKVKKMKPENVYCEGCPDMDFSSREDLILHRRADHGMLTCDLCDKFYGRTSHLWKHVNKLHRGHPSVTCSQCGIVSASKAHLRSHILKMHRSGNSSASSASGQGTQAPSTSKSGKVGKSEGALGAQACPQCAKVFSNRYRMLCHVKTCGASNWKQEDIGPFPCQSCPKLFDKLSALKNHVKNCHVTYSCELCGEGALGSKTILMEHIMIAHRGSELLTCSVEGCGLVLRCSADREKHENQHRQGVPPTCQICGELYTNKLRLRKHLVVHHKKDPGLLCGVCLTAHRSADELRAHVLSEHENVASRSNSCCVCARPCGGRSQVIKHVNHYHEGKTRLCTVCLNYFSNQEDLQKHVEDQHSKEGDKLEEDKSSSSEGDEDNDEDNDEDDNNEDENRKNEKNSNTLEGSDSSNAKCLLKNVGLNGLKTNSRAHGERRESSVKRDGTRQDATSGSKTLANTISKAALSDDRETLMTKPVSPTETRPRRSYKCNICKESFRMPSQLMQHQKQRHRSSSKPLQCASCEKTFSNKVVFLKHMQLCKKSESSILQQTLETGKKCVPEKKRDVEDLASIVGFNGHFLEGSCKEGNVVGNIRANRQNRKVYGGTEGPVHCQLCNKVWPALKHQWQHLIRTHREAAATTCGVCLEVCSSYASLSAHLNDAHPDCWEGEGKNFTCRICGRYHNARSKLELHNTIHLGMESDLGLPSELSVCSSCLKVFETKEELETHKISHLPPKHSGLKSADSSNRIEDCNENQQCLVCPSCPMVFTQEEELHDHMAMKCEVNMSAAGSEERANDGSYSCQRCNKASFSSYINLTKHYKFCPDGSNTTITQFRLQSAKTGESAALVSDQNDEDEEQGISNGLATVSFGTPVKLESDLTAFVSDEVLKDRCFEGDDDSQISNEENYNDEKITRQAVEDLVKDIKDLGSSL